MLTIENISKKYNSKKNNEITALKDVNLYFDHKELVFILGPSGCGKTTLLNLIGGIDVPTDGNIKINNRDIGTTEEKLDIYRNNHIGFVFQDFNLLENMTIYDNLSLVCFDDLNKNQKISYYLEKVGLNDFETRYPNELSGGQIQRVAIARALLKESDILLADEPTGNLNEEMSKEIFDLLKLISKEKLVIVVTHNKEMAELYGDRIIELKDGSVISNIEKTFNHEIFTIEEKKQNKTNKKNIFKLAFKNFKSNKIDIIFNSLILFLSFMCIAVTFSIVNYSRVDTDIKNLQKMSEIENFSLERYNYNDTLARNVSYAQVEQIKNNNPNMKYIQDGIITGSQDLLDFGLELYANYNEISYEGIYIFEYKIKEAVQNGRLYYDNAGREIVENQNELQYSNLNNTYLLVDHYGIKEFIKIDGIVKNLVDPKKHSLFESKEAEAMHLYYYSFQERISTFYLKEGIYANKYYNPDYLQVHSSFIDGPFEMKINNEEIENVNVLFAEVMYGNFQSQSGDIIITDNQLITDFNAEKQDDLFNVNNENEIYISLSLYNLIFNEYSDFNYYIEKTGFRKYQIKNIPSHIGEKISLDIIDYYFNDYSLNYDELIIKGVILDEYGSNVDGAILISNTKFNEISELISKPNIYINKSSINDINSFVKECAKFTVRPNYMCSEGIDTFEENIKMLKLVFSILSAMLLTISFLVMYSFANRLIRKKTKEFGILKAIGMCNKDIVNIFNILIYMITIILLLLILPLSNLAIFSINNIVVSEMYAGLTIIYYKWWYSLIIIAFIFSVMSFASLIVLSKLSKMKAISLIRNNNN